MRLRSGCNVTDDATVQALLELTTSIHPTLQVKPSQVPGGGDGLFAKVNLPANRPIVLYYGVLRLYRVLGRYCIDVCGRRTLDAEPVMVTEGGVMNKGRFVNDARGTQLGNNMRYAEMMEAVPGVKGRDTPFVVMYSRRRIAAGEELLASYGKGYWKAWSHLCAHSEGDGDNVSGVVDNCGDREPGGGKCGGGGGVDDCVASKAGGVNCGGGGGGDPHGKGFRGGVDDCDAHGRGGFSGGGDEGGSGDGDGRCSFGGTVVPSQFGGRETGGGCEAAAERGDTYGPTALDGHDLSWTGSTGGGCSSGGGGSSRRSGGCVHNIVPMHTHECH